MDATHREFMEKALFWAKKAGQIGEIPIGAVLVSQTGRRAGGRPQPRHRPVRPDRTRRDTGVAEAAGRLDNYRLLDTTLYVTVEPCPMCMGAIIHARVARVVFGAHDPKWGAAGSLYDFAADRRFNHHPEIVSGVLAAECRELMQAFFKARRLKAED